MYGGGRGQIWVWSFGLSTLVIAHALIPPQSPQPWHNLLDPCLDEVSLLRGVPQSRPFSDIALLQVFGVNGDHLAQSRHGGRRTIMGGNWARFRTNKMHTSTWLRRAWAEVGAGADGESHLERFVLRGRRRRVLAFGQLNHLDNLRR